VKRFYRYSELDKKDIMITIQQLIQVAPFPEPTRQELLAKMDSFSDVKKVELEFMCWEFISQWYNNEVRSRQEIMLLEMAKGEKKYTKEEIKKVPDILFAELTAKFAIEAKEEDLNEVRERLASLNNPTETTEKTLSS
jgi:histidinol phosphatase-like enzyme